MSPEISLLSDLHASLTGSLPKHCRTCNKGAKFVDGGENIYQNRRF
jgi:hypothetical protein